MSAATAKKKTKPNKRVTPRAASFKRIAKCLKVRAATYGRMAKFPASADYFRWKSNVLRDIAAELDNEAATLRAMR